MRWSVKEDQVEARTAPGALGSHPAPPGPGPGAPGSGPEATGPSPTSALGLLPIRVSSLPLPSFGFISVC